IRVAAARLLKAGHVNDVVAASFARLIVDEYQDCSVRQHALVGFASNALPTSVLGDPMQAIFGFGQDNLAKWDETVCQHFPLAGESRRPRVFLRVGRWVRAESFHRERHREYIRAQGWTTPGPVVPDPEPR